MGKALHGFADLIDNASYEILPAEEMPCGRTRVRAVVTDNVGRASEWTFVMVRTHGGGAALLAGACSPLSAHPTSVTA
jgi:hypothetical protein